MDKEAFVLKEGGHRLSGQWSSYLRHLPHGTFVLLIVYFVLMLEKYPQWRDLWPSLAGAAALFSIVSIVHRPPSEKPVWPYWVFIGAVVGYFVLNLLALCLAPEIPDMGNTNMKILYLPGILIALATGLGLRGARLPGRFLTAILIVSGLWYVKEAVSLVWTSPYLDNKLVLSRPYHTVLAMELVLVLSLFIGYAALSRTRRHCLLSLAGAVLVAGLLLMTQTRSALLVAAFVTLPCVALVQNRWGSFRKRMTLFLILFCLVAPLGSMLWFSLASPERRSLTNAFGRFQAYMISVQISMERSCTENLFGNGRYTETFPAVARHYGIDPRVPEGPALLHAHNVLLQTLVETGLLGTMALLLAWVAAAHRALSAWVCQEKTVAGVMVIALLTMAAMGQFDHCLNDLWGVHGQLCWFLVGLAFASGS